MIAEAGLAALWFAAALALLQVMLTALGLWRARSAAMGGVVMEGVAEQDRAATASARMASEILAAVRPIAVVQGVLVVLAMLLLIAVFVQTDTSVRLVVEDSSAAKPLIYKIARAWGNH
jgi:cytochrome c-type biogenesis protein CcmF